MKKEKAHFISAEDNDDFVINESHHAVDLLKAGAKVSAYHAAINSGFPVYHWKDHFKVKTSQDLNDILVESYEQFETIVQGIVSKRKLNNIINDCI